MIQRLVPRIFCSGAPTSTCWAASTHAFKVNFCKFTNETRLYLEDMAAECGDPHPRRAQWHVCGGRLRARHGLRRDRPPVDDGNTRRQSAGGAAPRRPARVPGASRASWTSARCAATSPMSSRRSPRASRDAALKQWDLVDKVVPSSRFQRLGQGARGRSWRTAPGPARAHPRRAEGVHPRPARNGTYAAAATVGRPACSTATSADEPSRAATATLTIKPARTAQAHRPTPRRRRTQGERLLVAGAWRASSTTILLDLRFNHSDIGHPGRQVQGRPGARVLEHDAFVARTRRQRTGSSTRCPACIGSGS